MLSSQTVHAYITFKTFTIHPKQHAYQAGKSAESALHHMVSRIEKALNIGQLALGAFIDLIGAFSNMTFKSIAKACRDHNIDESIVGWIQKMLKDRIVNSYLGDCKVSVFVSKGCPQGGVPPPLLYCLVKDSLLSILNGLDYYTQSFADDLAVILIGLFTSTL